MSVHRRELEYCLYPTGIDQMHLISLCMDLAGEEMRQSPARAILFHILMHTMSEEEQAKARSCIDKGHYFLEASHHAEIAALVVAMLREEQDCG